MSRFVVRTVTGAASIGVGNNARPMGLSAHVCDTLYLYAVVKTFRSEAGMPGVQAGTPGRGTQYGVARALAAAEAHAARLNRDTA